MEKMQYTEISLHF